MGRHGSPPATVPGSPASRLSVPYEMFRLPNGLTVIVHEEAFVPQALATDAARLRKAARAVVDTKRIARLVVGDRAKVEARSSP